MYTVIGIRNVNFNDRASGATITGKTIYCTVNNEYVQGVEGKKFFVPARIDLSWLKPNDKVEIAFNEYGKVADVYSMK